MTLFIPGKVTGYTDERTKDIKLEKTLSLGYLAISSLLTLFILFSPEWHITDV